MTDVKVNSEMSKDQNSGSKEPIGNRINSEAPKSNNNPWSAMSMGRLFFLMGVSLALSTFTPFSIFVAAPLAMALLVYGPLKAVSAFLVTGAVLSGFIGGAVISPVSGVIFSISIVYAFCVFLIVKKQFSPSHGLFRFGIAIGLVVLGAYLAMTQFGSFSLESHLQNMVNTGIEEIKSSQEFSQIVAQGGDEVRALQDLIKNPKSLVKEMVEWAPSAVVVSIFLTLWTTLFIVLRNSFVWRGNYKYSFQLKDLVQFRAPDWFVYAVIIGLALIAGGDYILGKNSEVWGMNILYSFGIFYLFQGIGLVLELFDSLKIFGLFRSMLLMFMVFSAWKIIAVVGLFDHWFDFKKILKKDKNNEGDLI